MKTICDPDMQSGIHIKSKWGMMLIAAAFIAVFAVSSIGISDDSDASYSFTADGINYEIISNNEVTVIAGDYSGAVVIPSKVYDSGRTYTVVSIGSGAFSSLSEVNSVTIPATVKFIGSRAFYACNGMLEYIVEEGNTHYSSVDGVLFSDGTLVNYPCGSSASTYTVPDGVTAIGKDAFYAAVGLSEIVLGSNVSDIGEAAFFNCSGLKKFTVSESNQHLSCDNGVLYDKNRTSLICYPAGSADIEYTVPDTVRSICSYAFCKCSSLKTVCIGAGVTSIGDLAFYVCPVLSEVTVDSDNKDYSSDRGILFNKDRTELIICPLGGTGITYDIPGTVVTICDYSFFDTTLAGVTIPSSVTRIGEYAFSGATFNTIVIPDSVMTIGAHSFESSLLKTVTVGSGLEIIGDDAFFDCKNFTAFIVDPDNSNFCSIDGVLFDKEVKTLIQCPMAKTETTYVIPSTVDNIGPMAFCSCNALISIDIPDTVVSLGYKAFSGCRSLGTVSIGSGMLSIGGYAFNGCTSLTSVTLGDQVSSIGDRAFENTRLSTLTIPASVVSLGDCVFYNDSQIYSFNVDDDNQNYCSVDGVLFDKDMTTLVCYPAAKADASYIIPDTVEEISGAAFYKCLNISSVTIPEGVKTIGNEAFCGCKGLTLMTIPSTMMSIGDRAFDGCKISAFTVIDGNRNYCSVDGVLFDKDMTTLICYPSAKTDSSYIIPDTVKSIGKYAFKDASKLTSVTIPEGVLSIGEYAFYNAGLTSLTIPKGVEYIDEYAFDCCYSMETATFLGSIRYVGLSAFNITGMSDLFVYGTKAAVLGYKAIGSDINAYVPYDRMSGNTGYVARWSAPFVHLKPSVEMPTAGNLTYNGEVQFGVIERYKGYTAAGNSATDVGSYTAVLTLADGVCWYDKTQEVKSIPWSISHKQIIVKADDISKRHGNKDPELTATVTGLVGDDKVVYVLSRDEGEDIGKYTIDVSGEAIQGNYSVTYESGTFTVEEDLMSTSAVLWVIAAAMFVIVLCVLLYVTVKKD